MALITYIGHSGFLIEWEHCVWLFDYYQGDIPEFAHEKKVFVFCSHKHADHFNPGIFSVFEEYPDVSYVLSRDLAYQVKKLLPDGRQAERITYLKAYQEYREDDGAGGSLCIQTLHSTDCGVAFLVTYETESFRRQVYHAGDLNWWIWKGESKQEIGNMTARYQAEMERLREWTENLNVAFVPLDPRQEEWYRLGMDWFMERIGAEHVFPMHFWGNFDLIREYRQSEESRPFAEKIAEIRRDGQTFEI